MAEDSWVVASRRRKNMKMNMSNPKESGRPPPAESNAVRTFPEAESWNQTPLDSFPEAESWNQTPLDSCSSQIIVVTLRHEMSEHL